MADPTPLMLVTNAGLAAASLATPTGPFINIVEFRVGDAYGYTPTRNDTGLNGNLLYVAAPTQYRNVGNNTIDIVCQIPPDAGPFPYGEVGIYNLDSGGNKVLFAKAVFDTPQIKYSSLGTNIATSETFHCLIKLEQSIAIFQFSTVTNQELIEYDLWSDVIPPGLSANPDVPLVLVRELDGARCSSLLTKSDDTKWTVGTNYPWFKNTTIVNATSTSVTVSAANFLASDLTTINRKYVLEFSNGYFRSVSQFVNAGGGNYRFDLNPAPLTELPPVGGALRVYESINYKTFPLGTNTIPGMVRAGDGLIINSPGVMETHGLLHDVNNSGRVIDSATNINDISLPSGEYTIYDASRPAQLPLQTTRGGRLRHSNASAIISQHFFPAQFSNSDSDPNSKMWWRMYDNGSWSPWRSFTGSSGGGGTWDITSQGYPGGFTSVSGTFASDGDVLYANNSGRDPAIAITMVIPGGKVAVVEGDSNGGGEGVTMVGVKDATWTVSARRSGTIYLVFKA